MTPDRIGRMSFGGDFVSFVSRYAGGLFARPGWRQSCTSWTGSMQVVDTVRKAQFDKENPRYWASVATHDGREDASTSLNGRSREVVRAAGGRQKRVALFTALRGAGRRRGGVEVHECVTQLHCEWTEQVSTVCPIAGFTGLLQGGSRSAKVSGANRLCGPA